MKEKFPFKTVAEEVRRNKIVCMIPWDVITVHKVAALNSFKSVTEHKFSS